MMPQRLPLASGKNGPRPRVVQLAAFALLLLGLLLLDRGFVSWRNDPRTLRDVAGNLPSGAAPAKANQRGRLMLSGAGMLVLFTREPV